MRQSRHVVTALGLAFISSTHAPRSAAPAVCQQAEGGAARTVRVGAAFSIAGAGQIELDGGRSQIVWTGRDCAAWVITGGRVSVTSDEQDVVAATGAEFVAVEERDGANREYRVISGNAAQFRVNNQATTPTPEDREWIAGMVREYVRRTGMSADERAQKILAAGGVAGLLAEVRQIHQQRVRVTYLRYGFANVQSTSDQAAYISDAAALVENSQRAEVLLAIPRGWRTSLPVLDAVYNATTSIEPDGGVIAILDAFPPPPVVSGELRRSLERMIGSLSSDEDRRAWSVRYLR